MEIKPARLQDIEKSVEAIVHYYKCSNSNDRNCCHKISCKKIEKLDKHMSMCTREYCDVCAQFSALLRYHSKKCQDDGCEVLNCQKMKQNRKIE